MSNELKVVAETPISITKIIKDKIIKNCIIFSSSSSSSSYAQVWEGFRCLLDPQNELFLNYVSEHRAFTLNQTIKGSGLPRRHCRYLIDTLVDSGLLMLQLHAKGDTKPFNIYLFKGENQDYARQALRLHNDEFAGQLGLDDSIRLKWVEEVVTNLKKRRLIVVDRAEIISESIKQNGGYDKRLAIAAINAFKNAGMEVS